MTIDNCPCKGCTAETGRSPTCHGTCQKYKEWAKLQAEFRKKLHKKAKEKEYGEDWKFSAYKSNKKNRQCRS